MRYFSRVQSTQDLMIEEPKVKKFMEITSTAAGCANDNDAVCRYWKPWSYGTSPAVRSFLHTGTSTTDSVRSRPTTGEHYLEIRLYPELFIQVLVIRFV